MKAEQEHEFRPITVTFETAKEVDDVLEDLRKIVRLGVTPRTKASADLYDALSAIHLAGKANWMTG